jgi:hypothetical protein
MAIKKSAGKFNFLNLLIQVSTLQAAQRKIDASRFNYLFVEKS